MGRVLVLVSSGLAGLLGKLAWGISDLKNQGGLAGIRFWGRKGAMMWGILGIAINLKRCMINGLSFRKP